MPRCTTSHMHCCLGQTMTPGERRCSRLSTASPLAPSRGMSCGGSRERHSSPGSGQCKCHLGATPSRSKQRARRLKRCSTRRASTPNGPTLRLCGRRSPPLSPDRLPAGISTSKTTCASSSGASERMGAYDSAAGERFHWNLTRQFVLNDRDGEYDHMEQLSLTLFFDSDDPDLVGLGSGDVWSGGGLDSWLEEVVDLQAFRAVRERSPRGLRVEQYEV